MPKPCRVCCCFSLVLAVASAHTLLHDRSVTKKPHEPLRRFGTSDNQTRQQAEDTTSKHPPKANEVDVLAFGDSLTDGFGRKPYPAQLQEMLNAPSRGQTVYLVANAGVPGELTASMVARLPDTIAHLKARGRKPTFVLILGGTNDLLWANITSDIVLANLRSMRATALHENVTPMLFTIPQLDVEESAFAPNNTQARIDARESAILAVNKALEIEAQSDASMLLADISKIRRKHLIDGVHFSGDGYAKVAEIAFDVMKPVLS